MSIYLAKAYQGLKVIISLYLCLCSPPFFFWGGRGQGLNMLLYLVDHKVDNECNKSSFKPLYLLIRFNLDAEQ